MRIGALILRGAANAALCAAAPALAALGGGLRARRWQRGGPGRGLLAERRGFSTEGGELNLQTPPEEKPKTKPLRKP